MSAKDLIEQIVMDKPTLSREEVSEVSGLQVQTLAKLAMDRKGPPMIKLGRACRYPRPGVVDWMARNAMVPTVL